MKDLGPIPRHYHKDLLKEIHLNPKRPVMPDLNPGTHLLCAVHHNSPHFVLVETPEDLDNICASVLDGVDPPKWFIALDHRLVQSF